VHMNTSSKKGWPKSHGFFDDFPVTHPLASS